MEGPRESTKDEPDSCFWCLPIFVVVVDVLVILGWSIEKLGDLALFPTLSWRLPVPAVVVGGAFPVGVGDLNILEKENGDPSSIPEITLGALS